MAGSMSQNVWLRWPRDGGLPVVLRTVPRGVHLNSPDCQGVYILRGVAAGWFQCYWCWTWEYGMDHPDPIPGHLCMQCIHRYVDGEGPPWSPNNLQRCQEWLRRMVAPGLPEPLMTMIPELARLLAHPWVV